MIKPEHIIGDEELNEVFQGCNFGSASPREIVADTILKSASGFETGNTAKKICIELRLIDDNFKLKERGNKYFRAAFWDLCTKVSPTEREKCAFNAAREEIFQDRFGKWKYPTFEDYLNSKNNKNDNL